LRARFRGGSSGSGSFGELPEMVVIVQCEDDRYDDVRSIMQRFRALSVGRIAGPEAPEA